MGAMLLGVDANERWFSDLEFEVTYEEADGFVWARLARNGKTVAPRYGRGATREDAVASARRRYEVEEIG